MSRVDTHSPQRRVRKTVDSNRVVKFSLRAALVNGVLAFIHSWPRWVAFTFAHGLIMSTAIVSAVVRFGRYCEEDIDGTLSCSNLGWIGSLAVIGLLGIAMYITVGCVWAQRRSNAKPRLTSTVASACILLIPMMAGVVALLLGLQSYNSFGLTSDNHLFLIICAVVLGSVVIVTRPVSFGPAAYAAGHGIAVAWIIFKTNVLRTLVLIVATMLFFVSAVICSNHEYTLPLISMFVLGTPVVVLVWLECFWQSVARIDRLPVPKLR